MSDKILAKLREYYRTLSAVPANAQNAAAGLGRAAGNSAITNLFNINPSLDLQNMIAKIYGDIVPRITNRAGWGEVLNMVQPHQDPLQVIKDYFTLKENSNVNRK